ncbi:MAG: hypothetical protein WCD89_05870 [Anaerocolumna sp.]
MINAEKQLETNYNTNIKGMAKSAIITGADKRAMDYYLTQWGGRTYQSTASFSTL